MSDDAPRSKAAPGWYADPKVPNTMRYWAGEDGWTEQRYTKVPKALSKPQPLRASDRPGAIIVGAIFFAVLFGMIAGGIYEADHEAGTIAFYIAVYFSSVIAGVGVIAKGVELGIRAARHREDLDF